MALIVTAGGAVMAARSHRLERAGGEKDEAMHLKGDPDKGKDVYEVCSACHMPEGWVPGRHVPHLAGQASLVIIKQLATSAP